MSTEQQAPDEFGAIVKMLEDDASNLKLEDAIKDYIVPILIVLANDSNVIKHNLFKVSESSALALLTSQKTLAGELLTEIANNYVVVQPEIESLSEEAQEAFSTIGALLSSWLEVSDDEDYDDDDDDYEEDEEEEADTSLILSSNTEEDNANAESSQDNEGSSDSEEPTENRS